LDTVMCSKLVDTLVIIFPTWSIQTFTLKLKVQTVLTFIQYQRLLKRSGTLINA